jgi:hypothetical protein
VSPLQKILRDAHESVMREIAADKQREIPKHECWFDRNGYCKVCGKDGGPAVYGP